MRFILKPTVFLLSLTPLGYLVWLGVNNHLGVDPAKAAVDFLGLWALRFLWITLSISPLRRLTGIGSLLRFRRMMGLYTWFYASVHVTGYLMLLLQWQWSGLWDDIVKRPYITVGFTAFMLLLPLGLTSSAYAVRKLGKNWKRLHQLIYVIAVLVLVHFLWAARSDITQQVGYLVLLIALFATRANITVRKKESALP